MSGVDVVFVGSSPNALVAAARLAKRGAKVTVLETRAFAGGPVATEAFSKGFFADSGVMSAAVEPEIMRELGLESDIEILRRDSATLLGDSPTTLAEAPALPRAFFDAVEIVRAMHRLSPPRVPSASANDRAALGEVAARLLGLGARAHGGSPSDPRAMHEVLRLTFISARDYLEENLRSEAERTLLAVVALRNLSEGPFAPGTLYPLLHRFAIDDALFGSTAKGGLGALSSALANAARKLGVDVRLGVSGPVKLEIVDGAARGVRLGDGMVVSAKHVVSDFDARTTLTSLVSPRDLDPEINRAVRHLRYRGVTARVQIALKSAPIFRGVDEHALRGTLVIAGDVAGIERAWDAAKRGKLSPKPIVELTVPSTLDSSLAPPGHHVIDASIRYVPYGRVDRGAVLESLLLSLERFDREIRGRVVDSAVSLPEDLERRFGLAEGHLEGGEVRLDQAFFLRPLPGYAGYASPIEHLWLGGSGAHPGGYRGRAGENLARELAAKLKA
jgi:phytoene dehydrogenase-like protein